MKLVSNITEDGMRSRKPSAVPTSLVDRIDAALSAVDGSRAELAEVVARAAPLRSRREAYARVRHAFDEADALLREATALARERSFWDGSRWRRRLSSLDTARQLHLFAEMDDPGVLLIASVRALDTGMSGPAIGDLQHGQTRAPGSVPGYGLDLETALTATSAAGRTIVGLRETQVDEPMPPAAAWSRRRPQARAASSPAAA
jgi:hypothetical protein